MYLKLSLLYFVNVYCVVDIFPIVTLSPSFISWQPRSSVHFSEDLNIGIFVDKLSGAPLFDTNDRFNSSSGWLSFTAPIKGSVYTKPDNSYGMRRTEIRSVTSDIHLGHVFPDGPNGMPRYCINATVLEFIPREDLS